MTSLDTQKLSRELIRALRGARSQPALSRQLGFKSNVVYSWEHGRRYPEVSLFLRAAAGARPALRKELASFFDAPVETFEGRRLSSPRTVTRLVQMLVGTTPKSRLAAQLEVDRTTLGRWCTGNTEPRLPEFLALMQASTQRLLSFVGLFADLRALDSTRELFQHFLHQQRLAYDLPLSHAVLRALELEAYRAEPKHDSAFLARKLGLAVRDVDRFLEELVAAGLVVRSGAHYAVTEILTIDTREDPEQNRRLKEFWAREAVERFGSGKTSPEALFSFNLFAISEEGYQQIRELHLAHFDRVRGIIEQSATADRVMLMNLQLLPLGTSK